jgi:hypothetical protein
MDVKQTCWQVLAAKRWAGFAIQGDGEWAVVQRDTNAVMLLTFQANAWALYRAAPHSRQVFKLEIETKPEIWERDDYDGPSN